jgi:serine phosphatase RsbU (regulator of sigma subunit)
LSSGIRIQQLTLMGIVGAVLVVGTFRAVALARRFSAPIESLVDESEQISQGNLEPGQAVASEIAEIRSLAEAHDTMRESLKSVIKLEKLERDLDIARGIQLGLLPKESPNTPGFEIAGWNRPADKTGGDYFDWLTLPDGQTLFTLADVTGHGIGPALIVAVYRAYMRASAADGKVDLSEVVRRVNDLLCADMPEGRFITAALGIISPAASRVQLLSAGQAPMLFFESSTNTIHNWDADDLPLGVADGVDFGDGRQISFLSGDILVLTTDGFFEAVNAADEQFGIQAVERFIREHHRLSPDDFIHQLYRQVEAHVAGQQQADDLTALVIKKSVSAN